MNYLLHRREHTSDALPLPACFGADLRWLAFSRAPADTARPLISTSQCACLLTGFGWYSLRIPTRDDQVEHTCVVGSAARWFSRAKTFTLHVLTGPGVAQLRWSRPTYTFMVIIDICCTFCMCCERLRFLEWVSVISITCCVTDRQTDGGKDFYSDAW